MAGIRSFKRKYNPKGIRRFDGGGYASASAEADAGKEGASGLGANPGSNGSMGIGQGLGGFVDAIGGMIANPTSGGLGDVGIGGGNQIAQDELYKYLMKIADEQAAKKAEEAKPDPEAEAAAAAQKAKIAKSYANPMAHIAGGGTGYQGALDSYRPNYYAYGRAPVMEFGANFQQPGRTGGMDNAIKNTYQDTLGRSPDPEGAEYWRQQMLSGSGPSAFRRDFMSGAKPELASMMPQPQQPPPPQQPAGPDYTSMVNSAYKDVLGRDPDAEGAQYWTNQLQTGAVKPDDFMNSFRSGGYEDEVFDAYKDVLGRAPDEEGKAYWLNQLQSGAVRPEDFVSSFRSGAGMAGGGLAALSAYRHYADRLGKR